MKTLLHICCAPCANQCIDVLRADGIEPWVCAGIYSREEIGRSAQLGASLITTDYPARTLEVLRELGYHR